MSCKGLSAKTCRGRKTCAYVKGECRARSKSRSKSAPPKRRRSASKVRKADVDYENKVTQLLYQLVKDVHDVLVKFRVPYEIIGGTLLGAVRHGGMIPHDDDADIEVQEKYLPRLKADVFPTLKTLGYRIDKAFFGFKVSPTRGFPIKGYPYKFPFLDLFLCEIRDGRTYFTETDEWNDKHYFEEMFLTPRRLYPFGPIELFGPNNAIPHLNRGFGPDWSSTWYRQYDHANEKAVQSKKVKMRPQDFKPRVPVEPLEKRVFRSK